MSKKRFIQAVVARALPKHGKLGDAIAYAENLWDGLTQYGYGADAPATPRESRNWHDQLNDRQRRFFLAFWKAFSYKKDLNGAAMRWGQLGELSDGDYQVIIDAAAKEALKPLPQGQARKMAQGWLYEKRWLDYKPEEKSVAQQKNHALSRLINELKAIEKLYENSQNPALKEQIDKLKQAINEANGQK